ncbi:head-tail connector protein [Klebsiella sp. LTGPAF-6F]|uniref:head-tail connector protein n=1 Tax=Klebsiella sp. LTGPAF-6F TaxID=1905288 RepID=UPI001E3BC4F8|nr:head-tail connector protein [Klebsiella sp. LTGPAF-6F]
MTVINTETAMEHLRLDDEIDKTMVEGYLAAAEDAAMQFLNRRFLLTRLLWIVLLRMKVPAIVRLSSRPPFRARFFL